MSSPFCYSCGDTPRDTCPECRDFGLAHRPRKGLWMLGPFVMVSAGYALLKLFGLA